jgi:ATP/maltotriose-dependent transcriptional regulator MalT
VCERDPIARGSIAQARAYIALSESDAYAYQRHCRDAREAFLQSGDIRTGMTLSTNIGYAAMNLGGVDSAELAMRDGLSSAVRMGLKRIEAANRHNLGILLARRGRYDEAEHEEHDAMVSLEAQGDRRLGSFARAYFAEILRQQDKLTEALEHARKACESAQGFSGPLAYALTVLAATLLDSGDAKGALDRITEARTLVDVTGAAEDGDAFLRWVQARALEANGDVGGARVCIEEAKRRLDERLARLPDDAARKQFIEGVPEHADTLAFAARLGVS